jgi:hypothetical protein
MIIVFVGGIGSGKSVSVIKELHERSKYSEAYVNFETKKIPNVKRIRMDWIVDTVEKEGKKQKVVNYPFWNKLRNSGKRFSIYLDEIHNIMHSRMSMTKQNVLMSMWISQIRKVFGEAEKDHLYCISQKLRRIDISLRDLAHWIIECEKIETPDGIRILNTYYKGVEDYEMERVSGRKMFDPRPLFKYYDSYELLDFGNEVYL